MLNTQTKILLLVFAGLVLVYLLYNGNTENFTAGESNNMPHNMSQEMMVNPQGEQTPSMGGTSVGVNTEASTGSATMAGAIPQEEMIQYFPKNDYAPPESDWLKSKFNGRNKATPGSYKKSSYNQGKRGALGPSDWSDYFDHNNNVIGGSQTGDNDKFLPMDETSSHLAVFKTQGQTVCGSNQNCEPADLFDVDKYLPQEVNDDFFEVIPEPISVKNRHLINISQPIGINTIGTSLKNASWDIRGAPSCPKYVVSPWLQSSIEPDVNLKPLS